MKFQKRIIGLFLPALALSAFCAVAAAQTVELTLGDIYTDDHSNSMAERRFAELVEQKTKGEVKVNVFVNSSLGSERELAESLVAGSVDIAPSGLIVRFFPSLQILELPYLYKDLDHMRRVADAIAPIVQKTFNAQNVQNLGFLFLGPRSIAGRKPIRTLEDMQGLRLRVPELPLYVGMSRALGAIPTPVPFAEAYTSIETGVADAAEGEPASLFTMKWYEPGKYVSLTKHIWHFRFFVMNDDKFNSLKEEHRKALVEAAREAQAYQVELFVKTNEDAIARMKAAGAEIIETENLNRFAQAVADFHDKYAAEIGPEAVELLEKVRAID